MSIAMEHLTTAERRTLAEQLVTDPRPHGYTEIGGHCPFHVETTPGGAFFYDFERDLAYCHSCATSSDLVGIYNAVNGRGVADADGCAEFLRAYCKGRIPEQGPRPARQAVSPVGKVVLPPEVWSSRAESFVDHSVERLQGMPERLAELSQYGITAETARVCKIGWNDRDKYPPEKAWGLRGTRDDGQGKKIWLPAGLVIPAVHDGRVVKIKIRRDDPRLPWAQDQQRKYWEVRGGANRLYHVYGKLSIRVWVLVETERDAALVWQEGHALGVGAMGTGGAAKRPAGVVESILRRADLILNAMDFDQAGAMASLDFWQAEYPNAMRHPAPPALGKDVGEAVAKGLSIRDWIMSGIPNYVLRKMQERAAQPKSSADALFPGYGMQHALSAMADLPEWSAALVGFCERVSRAKLKIFIDDFGLPFVHVAKQSQLAHARSVLRQLSIEFSQRQSFDGIEARLCDVVQTYYADALEVKKWVAV